MKNKANFRKAVRLSKCSGKMFGQAFNPGGGNSGGQWSATCLKCNEHHSKCECGHSTQRHLAIKATPAKYQGAPLKDPAKVAQKLVVERSLSSKKYVEWQPSLMPEVPDANGQCKLF